MRSLLLRLLGVADLAQRLELAEQVIRRQEDQIGTHRAEKDALRASMQHWRHLYYQVSSGITPPEAPG